MIPSQDHRITIVHDGYQGRWVYRYPEVVDSEKGSFLTYIRTPMEWKEYDSGWIGYDWRPTPEYAAKAYAQTDRRRKMILGLQISPRIRTREDSIELLLQVTNVSNAPFANVYSEGGCLQHRTPNFINGEYERTYILTAAGLKPLTETDRPLGIRGIYFLSDSWFEDPGIRAYEFFWGRSKTRPVSGLIVSEAEGEKGAIGIIWEQSIGVRQNSDSHHCMHSSSYFGKIAPGETRSRQGMILFGHTARSVVSKAEKLDMECYQGDPRGIPVK